MKARALFLAVFALVTLTTVVYSQDKPKRPGDISVSEFDTFKNSSFDIVDASHNLKNNVTTIDNEIKNYSGVINTIAPDKLKKDLAALKGSKKEAETLADRIGKLGDQGKELVGKAKDVTPKMKSLDATSVTNKSIKGLDTAKGYIGDVTKLLDTNVKLITDELKKRNEPIE